MLEVIGAGTNNSNAQKTDFHAHYLSTKLAAANTEKLAELMIPNASSSRLEDAKYNTTGYNASYFTQFRWLMHRIALSYWRNPAYSVGRMVTCLSIALIFGSAYPLQKYSTFVGVFSRSAVIYVTTLFCGILALITVIPVVSVDRPVFYREQQSQMYNVAIYAFTTCVIELPYLLIASIAFTLPFFFIVGFNFVGNVVQKFFWYWLFNFLLQATLVYLGIFFVALAPDEATTQGKSQWNLSVYFNSL
jgi:hypothetical protein